MAEPTGDVAPTKTTTTKAPAADERDVVDPVAEYEEAKAAEIEKTNNGDVSNNVMADATDQFGQPVVGVTPDLYRPIPADTAPVSK